MQDRYRQAEQEYFKLRGQFDTGRISQEQFDEKLRELIQQDAQGRYWMLGADSGKWYFYDGTKWVQGDPYAGAAPPPVAAPPAPPVTTSPTPPSTGRTEPRASAAPAPSGTTPVEPRGTSFPASSSAEPPAVGVYAPPPNAPRGFPLVPLLLLLAPLLVAIAAFLIYQNRERIFVAQAPQGVTPILPPTITRAPSPTPLGAQSTAEQPTQVSVTLSPLATPIPPTEVPTQVLVTTVPTAVLETAVPAITLAAVTSEPVATIALPTPVPTATTVRTATPTPAPTKIPVTATQVPPTPTAAPTFPPNVYVTKITVDPSRPQPNLDATFTATFLNTTGQTTSFTWVILTYRQGQTKGFGESPPVTITVPPGESTGSLSYPPVTGKGGGCESFYAHAATKISQLDKPIFPNTSGDPAAVSFDVCQ